MLASWFATSRVPLDSLDRSSACAGAMPRLNVLSTLSTRKARPAFGNMRMRPDMSVSFRIAAGMRTSVDEASRQT